MWLGAFRESGELAFLSVRFLYTLDGEILGSSGKLLSPLAKNIRHGICIKNLENREKELKI
jgi:hypothetical protein